MRARHGARHRVSRRACRGVCRGTGSVAVGVGIGANALIGGGNKQVTLQPISIEGSVRLNVAAGLAGIELKKG